jgi:hypothetical protein
MSNRIRTVSVAVKANISDFEKNIKKAANQMQQFGTKMKSAGQAMTVGITAPILAVGTALVSLTTTAGKAADELITLSNKTGITTTALQELQYAARFIDVEVETMTDSMIKLTKNMDMARRGSEEQQEAFAKMKVSYQNADGTLKSAKAVWADTITALGKMTSEADRDAIALSLMGRSAAELNPLIKAGSDELLRLAAEAHTIGAVLSTESVIALGKFDDEMEKIKARAEILKSELAIGFLPVIESIKPLIENTIIPAIKKFISFIGGLFQKFSELSTGTQGFVLSMIAIVAAIGPVIWIIGSFATGLASIIKIIPMLVSPVGIAIAAFTLLAGTLIYLYNTNKEVAEAMDNAWYFLSMTIPNYLENLANSFKSVFGQISDAVKGFFGIEESPGEDEGRTSGGWSSAQGRRTKEFKTLAETVSGMFDKLKISIPEINVDGIDMDDIINKSQSDLNDLLNSFTDTGGAVDKFTDSVKNMVTAIRSQTKAFAEFTGIFDVFQRQSISGERLLNRMKAQVSAMGEWQQAMTTLEGRNINAALLEQVRAMGPQAVDQIKALSKMTDAQLAEYSNLFSQRYGIAGEQAEKVVSQETKIDTMIENQVVNINVENGDARKIANDIVRELRLAGVPI